MNNCHEDTRTNTPTAAPSLKLKRRSQARGAVHARRNNHSQTVMREAKNGRHVAICVSFPRLVILKAAVKRPTGSLNRQTPLQPSEKVDSARKLDTAVSEMAWLNDSHPADFKQVVLGVRQFAADVLAAQGVRCEITTPLDLERIKLTTEQCHHIFLIFKEALHNLARHDHCAATTLSVSVTHQRLLVEIYVGGSSSVSKLLGQSTTSARSGDGRRNLPARVIELRGALEMTSAPGWGAKLTLTIPLRQLTT